MDPRIERGTRAMLQLREARLAAGEQALGWKVGFGSPAAFERLGTDRPIAGFMTESGVLLSGASVDIGGWTNPHLELEVAAHIGDDGAIGGTSAAIELVDTHPVSTDPEEILAGNIYHRHVILGPVDDWRKDGEGVTGRLLRDGEELARSDDPAVVTGEVVEVVRLTAELLGQFGVALRAGDVVITGSVFAPVPVGPGSYLVELPPLGSLSVVLNRE
jgi:2-keto-4-pentenoate hydratase